MKQSKSGKHQNQQTTGPEGSCSLCGRKYNNFAFKGGYICESCLTSLKDPFLEPDPERKYPKHAKNL